MSLNFTAPSVISDPWLVDVPSKRLPFEFEKLIDLNEARIWARENLNVVFALSVVYFISVHLGPTAMRNRKPFNLQKPLVLWNFLLAVFSIAGAVRTLPTFFDSLKQEDGFHNLSCVRIGLTQPLAFWSVLFAVSKFFEFGDTAFIVLRKKPLIFLHWFHHLSVFISCFVALTYAEPVSTWAVVLNYSVHSVMYSYYTIMALRIKLPKWLSMTITSLQILQFVTGLVAQGYSVGVLAKGGECFRSPVSIKFCLTLGILYLSLFVRLFYYSYIAKTNTKSKTS